jgi:type I restriction enzyme, R subunit
VYNWRCDKTTGALKLSNPNRNEAITRKELIDPALKEVGWDVFNPEQVRTEIPVDGFDPKAWENVKRILEAGGIYEGNLPKGVSDYALYRPNGDIIAVVEAKRTSIDPRLAQTQAEFYVTQLEKLQGFRPFAFMTNGNDIYFLDAGNANKRLVSGFFSPSDLENLLFIRQHKPPLSQAIINIAKPSGRSSIFFKRCCIRHLRGMLAWGLE